MNRYRFAIEYLTPAGIYRVREYVNAPGRTPIYITWSTWHGSREGAVRELRERLWADARLAGRPDAQGMDRVDLDPVSVTVPYPVAT